MNKLEIAKQIIKENIDDAKCGIFDTLNNAGDKMDTLYNEDGLKIDICYGYEYFEVFGLSESEFADLAEYYASFLDF